MNKEFCVRRRARTRPNACYPTRAMQRPFASGKDADRDVGVDPVWYAMSKLRRRKFDAAAALCTGLLRENPYDKAVWFIKCRALTGRPVHAPLPCCCHKQNKTKTYAFTWSVIMLAC